MLLLLLLGAQPLGAVAVVVVDLDAVLLHQLQELRLQRRDLPTPQEMIHVSRLPPRCLGMCLAFLLDATRTS